MRLRLAPVEYKVCATEGCGIKYEGAQCPQCQHPFDPQRTIRVLHDRLILVDVDPPMYEQTHRCRCTECKSLFDLSEHDVVANAKCHACEHPLLSRAHMQEIWKNTATLLQRARRLDRARRQVPTCPQCRQPVAATCWCPLAGSYPHSSTANGLPQNPTTVWVRTFYTAESPEELQTREWVEADDEWRSAGIEETETAAEEMKDYVQKSDE